MSPVLPALLMIALPAVASPSCMVDSSERRVSLVELYTSEGCDSCPPADRWVSELPARGLGPDTVVVLGFHVDYWNQLGWIDPFAQRRFSDRQRAVNARNGSRVIYTPQLLLNGKDYRRGFARDDIAQRVAAASQRSPSAAISLALARPEERRLQVKGNVRLNDAGTTVQAFLALYENRLVHRVTAGENRGKQLTHDYVVRDLAGPFAPAANHRFEFAHGFEFARGWKLSNLWVAAFVQDPTSGDVLQAMAVPLEMEIRKECYIR